MTPYLANRLGPAEFGVLNLCISATEILGFVLFLGGPALLAAEYVRHGHVAARRLRAASIRISLWIGMALLIISFLIAWRTSVPLIVGMLTVGVSYVQGLNALELSYYRGSQEYKVAVAGQLSFAVMTVVLTVLAFELLSPTAANRLLCIVIAGGLVQFAYAFELGRKPYKIADADTRRKNTSLSIRFGMSVFVHVSSHWIRVSIDRFTLSALAGVATAGVYSVAWTMAMVPSYFFLAASQQLQPYMYTRLKNRNFASYYRIQFWFVCLVLIVTAIYYAVLTIFFHRVFSDEYDAARVLLPALLAGAAAQSVYFVSSHAAFYERRGIQISLLAGIALMVHLIGLGILALLGKVTPSNVALVFLISNATTALGMALLSRRTVRKLETQIA